MRLILAAVVCIVSLCSMASAQQEHLKPLRASVTYWTATNTLDFSLQVSRPLDLDNDIVQFIAWSPAGQPRPDEQIEIINRTPTLGDVFKMEHGTVLHPGPGVIIRHLGNPPYELTGDTIRFSIPFETTEIDVPTFGFLASVDTRSRGSAPIWGFSSTDSVVVYVPEPSSIALASLGVLGLIVHRFRRRQRCRRITGILAGRSSGEPMTS